MKHPVSDIAFTPSVKAVQERLGSRKGYASMEQRGGWSDVVTPELATFIGERDTMFIATAARRRAALHPAPRWAAGLLEGSGRAHAWIR